MGVAVWWNGTFFFLTLERRPHTHTHSYRTLARQADDQESVGCSGPAFYFNSHAIVAQRLKEDEAKLNF